jgi:hypothetical protein
MKTFSPSEAAFAGFRVIHRKPGAVLVWALAYIVVTLVMTALLVSVFGPQMAAFSQMSNDQSPDPQRVMALVSGMLGVGVVAVPIGVFTQSVLYAAIFRSVLRPADDGFGYLRVGADELRLIGLGFLQFFVFMGLYIGTWITALILIFLAHFIALQGHQPVLSLVVASVAVLAVVCGFIWVGVRLSLAAPMTFAIRKISVFGSWGVTKGRFWSLLGCYLLTFIFGILIAILAGIIALCVGAVLSGDWTTMGMLAHSPREAMMRSGVFSLSKLLTVAALAQIVVSSLLSTVSRTVLLAPFAEAYRELAEESTGDGPWGETPSSGALVL